MRSAWPRPRLRSATRIKQIQTDNPQLVARAIEEVVEAAVKRTRLGS